MKKFVKKLMIDQFLLLRAAVVVAAIWPTIGCDSGLSSTESGAMVGAAGGAGAGALIGHETGNTAAGVVIGGVAGGATGALVGSADQAATDERIKDQEEILRRQAEKMKQQDREIQDIRRQEYYNDVAKGYEEHGASK